MSSKQTEIYNTTQANGIPSARLSPPAAILLVISGGAWLVIAFQAYSMGIMAGAMDISLAAFVAMWTFMMAAMMLPSVAPLASRYIRMIQSYQWLGLASFTSGYLGVWAATGILAFLLAWLFGGLTNGHPFAATGVAVAIYAVCGLYQLTPLKYKCLSQCRAPFSLLLEYASWRGRLRHFRVGLHHGVYCLGCCWSLMTLMFAFGVMNVGMMLILAIVITIEKVWLGERFSRIVGWVCFALAVAVIWFPGLAPSLISSTGMLNMTE